MQISLDNAELYAKNKKVVMRVDFNVPMHANTILDDTKIVRTLPIINKLLQCNAKITLLSHLGRPESREQSSLYTLEPIAKYLTKALAITVPLIPTKMPQELPLVLLENLRFFPEEIANEALFAKDLINSADLFIMEAFASAHRTHASTYGIIQFAPQVYLGPLFTEELQALNKFINKKMPLTIILGGNKPQSKLRILRKLILQTHTILLGGVIANVFLQALGYNIGQSLTDNTLLEEARQILQLAKSLGCNIYLPQDVLVTEGFTSTTSRIKDVTQISDQDYIVDLGPKSIATYTQKLTQENKIFFNGALGIYEHVNFQQATNAIMNAITKPYVYSIVGGGTMNMASKQQDLLNKISYISTAGGAFLEYLATNSLATLDAIQQFNKQPVH